MRPASLLAALLAAASSAAAAQHGHGQNAPIHARHQSGSSPYGFHSASGYPAPYPTSVSGPQPTGGQCDYWLADIDKQGVAAFNPDPSSYDVFRNVKDFGAKGDGATDDTQAINRAIASGGRCQLGSCNSTTVTPAIVYFPPGVYAINASIIDYYYTQLIGNPNCLPTIRALPTFSTDENLGLIDGDPYAATGDLSELPTNIFFRQIRNFIIDTTLLPAASAATGIHWPSSQATSIQNVVFQLSSANGTQHQGLFIEEGSGGFLNDLVFHGGLYGAFFGNQQYTARNLTFNNAVTAINQVWDWGWTYKSISINNCGTGLNMTSGGTAAAAVGSVTFIDSSIRNTPVGIRTVYGPDTQPPAANSLILENVALDNVPIAVQGANNVTALPGTPATTHIAAWGQGHGYTPDGPHAFEGAIAPVSRPASLLASDGQYYERSKPQYEQYSVDSFVSARHFGATGDGHTDDTAALQAAIVAAAATGKILFLDHGDYLVSATILIPAGSRIVGESYSVILSHGSFFDNINNPQPVVRIGLSGEPGSIEWSDTIVSTQGQQRGAVLIEYNLRSSSTAPSGLWDVHTRIGGFAGSNLQLADCPTTPTTNVTSSNLNHTCIAAFLSLHVTKPAGGLYLENTWFWVADHDMEDPNVTQITVFAGRGLLDESTSGPLWLVGTGVEHHTKYEYQFVNAQNVFAGQIQTETAYYQPNPPAPQPFPYVASLSDPTFPNTSAVDGNLTIPDANGWGLRIVDSNDISIYGAGLYSFFNDYSTDCSAQGNGETCQNRIFELVGGSAITVYNLNTVGTHYSIEADGKNLAYYLDNLNGFISTVALFRSSSS